MISPYVICTCRRTLDLVEWKGNPFQLWIPLIVRGDKTRAAFPGYVFAPFARFKAARRGLPEMFAFKALGYDRVEEPWQCARADLEKMQLAINKPADTVAPVFEVGQRVVGLGLFNGMEGTITHIMKEGQRLRIVFAGKAITLPTAMVSSK